MNYPVSDIKKYYPLSFTQRRLWFLEQFDPGNIAYNVSSLYSLKGALDRSILERSLQEVFLRHEILRTTFLDTDDGPKQCVKYEPNFPIRFVDFTDNQSQDAQNAVQEEIIKVTREPYNLRAGPLIRVTLFKQSEGEHVLHIAMHHIITDGWSSRVLIKELSELYSAYCQESQSPLQPLPIQYGDFAAAQREQLQGAALSQQLDYWKEKLIDAQPLVLPTDYQRPARQTFEGSNIDWVFPEDLIRNLKALANNQRVTLFMILLAALKILVARYSQQQDVVIGIPIANRTRSELENLIGFFVNTLALRTNLADDPTIENLIHEIREETLQAYSHQDLPFEKLVEETHPERDLSRNPIYQVFFAFQNLPQFREEFADLLIERLPQKRTTVMTDLDIFAWEESGCLQGTFVYNKALFKPLTIKRMIGHYRTILEEIVADPSRRISQIQILTGKERTKILSEWNSTNTPFPNDYTLGELFEDQALKTPDAVALEFGDQTLSFSELNAHANQLARYLLNYGVVAESPVGVYMDRSMEQVIAILGVIKAGGAYVPLDPGYPDGRIQFMLQDSGCQVLITQSDLHAAYADYEGKVVVLDEEWADIRLESSDNPDPITTPGSAAYIIYTSGSTGMPKGVVGLHRGAVNRMNWMWRNYPFSDEEVCCLKTRISFVDSVWELFGPLLQGVRVVLIPDEVVQDPERLVEYLSLSRVTRLVLVPSLLWALLETVIDLRDRLPVLRFWITSGENLSNALYQHFREALPECRLLNLYGSSEVSADVAACELTSEKGRDRVSIGRPIDNSQIYILDPNKNVTPIGIPGEIFVGGAGLARGYFNRPDLTRERFVPNPFADQETSKLFKTGDLGRYWVNGEIEFLGRTDSQIKLRGFRIELEEIEATLNCFEGVTGAVVLKHNSEDQAYLAAFYQTNERNNPELAALRAFMQKRLPNHMIPASFTALKRLPLTPSGKVDRLKLAKVTPDRRERVTAETDTISDNIQRNKLQTTQRMIEVWQDVLKVEKIGTDDNFFDQGGYSLLAVDLILRVEKIFGVRLPIRALFEAPTPKEFTQRLRDQTPAAVHFTLSPVARDCVKPPLFLINGLFIYRELAVNLGSDQPTYGVYIEEEVDVERSKSDLQSTLPFATIEHLASKYLNEISAIQQNGPYQIGGESLGGLVAYEIAQQLLKKGEEVAALAMFDTNAPGALNTSFSGRLRNHFRNILTQGVPYIRKLFQRNSLRSRLKRKGKVTGEGHARKTVYGKYKPSQYPGKIIIFTAQENDWIGHNRERDLGWGRYADGGCVIYEIPGNHLGILESPNVHILGQKLKLHLLGAEQDIASKKAGAQSNKLVDAILLE